MKHPTRQEYLDKKVSHDDYYLALAKDAGVSFAESDLLPRVRAALAAGDEHLNSIPLCEWDGYAYYYQSRRDIREVFKAHRDQFSIAGAVCMIKAAARHAAGAKI